MGKSQSKVLNSVSVNLGLLSKRGDGAGRDPAELSLVRGRSTSLDSVNTAVSFGMGHGQPHPHSRARSCSVDNLHQSGMDSTKSAVSNVDPSCVEDERAHGLVQSGSGISSNTCPTEEEEGGESPQRGFTQSLPAEIERKISMRSKDRLKERDMDSFSDNFVTLSQDGQVPQGMEDIPRASTHLKSSYSSDISQGSPSKVPHLPPGLLQKLSPEELNEFITFVCATLGNSLQASIDMTTRGALLDKNDQIQHTSKQVKLNEGGTTKRESRCGKCPSHLPQHCRHRQLDGSNGSYDDDRAWRQVKNERPSSLPSLHLRDNPQLIERLRILSKQEAGEQEVGGDTCPWEGRSRSKSQDDCYHGDCQRRSHNQRYRSSRRRKREKNDRVDISLDDNCPGLPQNRVLRRSHRHHHQTPAVCEHCLERLNDPAASVGQRSPSSRRRRCRHLHSSSGEGIVSENRETKEEMSESFMTLQDMKLMTSDFLKGTNELDESVIHDLKMQFIRGMAEQMKQSTRNVNAYGCGNEHHSVRLDAIQPFLSRNRPKTKAFHVASPSDIKCGSWHQLAFPGETRTGLDSPRTDMAVFNLDINNDHMRQPIIVSDPASGDGSRGHLYLHKHHHIHHIIHHSQS